MSSEPDTTQKKLTENISILVQTTCVVIQWIPAHTSIRGNEIAHHRVKERRTKEQPPSHLSYRKSKLLSIIKRKPSSTARLEDTTQTRTHSISCHEPTDHHLSPQNRPLQTEQPSQEDWCKDLRTMPLWRGGPNTRTLPTVLLTPPASKAADMAHLCVPQNQALGVCRGFVPDMKVFSSHRRESLVNATITSNAEEEDDTCHVGWKTHMTSLMWLISHDICYAG